MGLAYASLVYPVSMTPMCLQGKAEMTSTVYNTMHNLASAYSPVSRLATTLHSC